MGYVWSIKMKKDYKNRAVRAAPVNRAKPQAGDPKDRIKIYLSGPHRAQAEKIAAKLNISLEALIERYISQMVADRRWPD